MGTPKRPLPPPLDMNAARDAAMDADTEELDDGEVTPKASTSGFSFPGLTPNSIPEQSTDEDMTATTPTGTEPPWRNVSLLPPPASTSQPVSTASLLSALPTSTFTGPSLPQPSRTAQALAALKTLPPRLERPSEDQWPPPFPEDPLGAVMDALKGVPREVGLGVVRMTGPKEWRMITSVKIVGQHYAAPSSTPTPSTSALPSFQQPPKRGRLTYVDMRFISPTPGQPVALSEAPTHVLQIYVKDKQSGVISRRPGERPLLIPVYALTLAAQCARLIDLGPSETQLIDDPQPEVVPPAPAPTPADTAGVDATMSEASESATTPPKPPPTTTVFRIGVVQLPVPHVHGFILLMRYLYEHETTMVVRTLIPGINCKAARMAMRGVTRFAAPSASAASTPVAGPSSAPTPPTTTLSTPRFAYPTLALSASRIPGGLPVLVTNHLTTLHGLWQSSIALGVAEDELWRCMDFCYDILVGAIGETVVRDIREGREAAKKALEVLEKAVEEQAGVAARDGKTKPTKPTKTTKGKGKAKAKGPSSDPSGSSGSDSGSGSDTSVATVTPSSSSPAAAATQQQQPKRRQPRDPIAHELEREARLARKRAKAAADAAESARTGIPPPGQRRIAGSSRVGGVGVGSVGGMRTQVVYPVLSASAAASVSSSASSSSSSASSSSASSSTSGGSPEPPNKKQRKPRTDLSSSSSSSPPSKQRKPARTISASAVAEMHASLYLPNHVPKHANAPRAPSGMNPVWESATVVGTGSPGKGKGTGTGSVVKAASAVGLGERPKAGAGVDVGERPKAGTSRVVAQARTENGSVVGDGDGESPPVASGSKTAASGSRTATA